MCCNVVVGMIANGYILIWKPNTQICKDSCDGFKYTLGEIMALGSETLVAIAMTLQYASREHLVRLWAGQRWRARAVVGLLTLALNQFGQSASCQSADWQGVTGIIKIEASR